MLAEFYYSFNGLRVCEFHAKCLPFSIFALFTNCRESKESAGNNPSTHESKACIIYLICIFVHYDLLSDFIIKLDAMLDEVHL